MMPIDSPGVVSYSTSIDFMVVSVTVLEIDDIKKEIVKINFTSGLAIMRLSDFHQNHR